MVGLTWLRAEARFATDFVQTARRRWLTSALQRRRGGVRAWRWALTPRVTLSRCAFARKVFGLELAWIAASSRNWRRVGCSNIRVSFFAVLEHVTDPLAGGGGGGTPCSGRSPGDREALTADSVSSMADIASRIRDSDRPSAYIMNYTQAVCGAWCMTRIWRSRDVVSGYTFSLVAHMALANPAFLDSRPLCQFFSTTTMRCRRSSTTSELSEVILPHASRAPERLLFEWTRRQSAAVSARARASQSYAHIIVVPAGD